VLTLMSTPATAQSLAELAKQESARRKAITAPATVITNADLPIAPAPAPLQDAVPPADGATPPTPDASAPPAASSADNAAAPEPEKAQKDEKYWRQRMATARATLARAQILQDALQSRINALSADFVNRDDPAQRAVVAADRQRALAELDRVKQEIVDSQKAIADTEEEARRAGVPAGWVR
jgi:hypothetical protein